MFYFTRFAARSTGVNGLQAMTAANRRARCTSRNQCCPVLDRMEDRTLLSSLTVTSTKDTGPGSLRNAIAVAVSGDTINFASSLKGKTITLTSGELTIAKSLDIEGPGSGKLSISGGGSSRVFDITSSGVTVTIAGLTISNGLAPQGGGVLDQGGALTLSSVVLTQNQAIGANPGDSGLGGGVAVTSDSSGVAGTLTVENCDFRDNLAKGAPGQDNSVGGYPFNGAGGLGSGGAIEGDPRTSITVSVSSFASNQALGGRGGKNSQGASAISNGSGGDAAGGAIQASADVTLSVSGSLFAANQAIGGRGGDGAQGGDFSINSGGGPADGGAISFQGPSSAPYTSLLLTVSSGVFKDNLCKAATEARARGEPIRSMARRARPSAERSKEGAEP